MRRKRTWFDQWNYNAPIEWFKKWLKKHCKKLYKILFTTLTIMLGIWLANELPVSISEVIANYQDEQELIKTQKIQKELEARQKEEAYKKYLQEQEEEKKHNEELKKQLEIKRVQDIEDEIKEQFQIGDRIKITWWDRNGAVTPDGQSATGYIKKIQGEYVYGTWGDLPLKYRTYAWHRIDAKEMRDIKKQEEQHALLLAKKNHKKWTDTMTDDEKRIYQSRGVIFNLKG